MASTKYLKTNSHFVSLTAPIMFNHLPTLNIPGHELLPNMYLFFFTQVNFEVKFEFSFFFFKLNVNLTGNSSASIT